MSILLFNLFSSTPQTRPVTVLFLACSSVVQAGSFNDGAAKIDLARDLSSSPLMPEDWISSRAPDRFLYVLRFFENSTGIITWAEFCVEKTCRIICHFSSCLNVHGLLAQDFKSFLFVFLIIFKRLSKRVCSWHVTAIKLGPQPCVMSLWEVLNSNHHLHIAPRRVGARKKMLNAFRICKRIMRSPRLAPESELRCVEAGTTSHCNVIINHGRYRPHRVRERFSQLVHYTNVPTLSRLPGKQYLRSPAQHGAVLMKR